MKHVEACFSPREDGESSFHTLWWHCEVGASLFLCGQDLIALFYPPSWFCESRGGQVYVPWKFEKAVFTPVEAL